MKKTVEYNFRDALDILERFRDFEYQMATYEEKLGRTKEAESRKIKAQAFQGLLDRLQPAYDELVKMEEKTCSG